MGQAPIGSDAQSAVRFSLLDMMAAVAAFGLGFGWVGLLSDHPPPLVEFFEGGVLGAILLPPLVMAIQWATGRRRSIANLGEELSLLPFLGLIFLLFGEAVRINPSGWPLLYVGLQGSAGLVAAIALTQRLKAFEPDQPLAGLEIYGYLICLAVAGYVTWVHFRG